MLGDVLQLLPGIPFKRSFTHGRNLSDRHIYRHTKIWRSNILILSMRVKKDSHACVFFYRQSLRNHSKPGKRKTAACCIEHSSINAATLPIIRTQPTRPCQPLSSSNPAAPTDNMAGSAVVSPACSAGRNQKGMNTVSLAMKSLIWCRCGTWRKSPTNCQWPLTMPA